MRFLLQSFVQFSFKLVRNTSIMSANIKIPNVKLNNGKEIPIFGLGTWKSEPQEVVQVVKDAIDLGYRHFDCAFLYENEEEVGQGFKAKIDEGVVKREDLFITSKLWNTFHRPELVMDACKTSVKNLGVGYIDLYLIHWPMAFKEHGDYLPKDEAGKVLYSDADYVDTWAELEKCVEMGLVRSIGVSNFNSQQILRILEKAKIKPVMNQVECHPWLNQKKLIEFCKSKDIAVTAYGPLGSPYRPLDNPDAVPLLEEPKLKQLATKHKKSVAQILLRFQVQRGVIAIPKSVKKTRLLENMDIFDFELSAEDMAVIETLESNTRLCGLPHLGDHPNFPFHIEF